MQQMAYEWLTNFSVKTRNQLRAQPLPIPKGEIANRLTGYLLLHYGGVDSAPKENPKMSEFLLVFRRDYQTPGVQPGPEQLQEHLKHWADWFRSLAAQDNLANPVQRYDSQGKIISGHQVVSGPFTASQHSVGNLIMVRARDYQQAVALAQGCPILDLGGTVEIRQVVPLTE
jgi:hypothetical protein